MRSPQPLRTAARFLVPAVGLATALTLVAPVPAASAVETLTIAQIQGTGPTTPVNGQVVTTTPSVVTAVYPAGSGSFNGFVIQTAGTGGAGRDLSRASDAIFVFTGTAATAVSVGDSVTVTGTAGEFQGLTQLSRPTVRRLETPAAAVQPLTGLRWSDTAPRRENLESMLWTSDASYTISDVYPLLPFGELGLTAAELPVQPTDAARPGSADAASIIARNTAITVNLDDGSNRGYTRTATLPGRPLPYLSADRDVRIGDRLQLTQPVIVDFRNNLWKFQPTAPVVAGQEPAAITSAGAEARPAVRGSFSIASFNVLNFFTTTGQGRSGCNGGNLAADDSFNVTYDCDVRGAWDPADLGRQRAKIVAAVNATDASVTGLLEIENSIKLGEARDEALASLVDALNAAAGSRKWAYVPSSTELQPTADQDVITSALIYQPGKVRLHASAYALGSRATEGQPFDNARTPIAAAFSPVAGGQRMLVVVNHFKSKSSSGAVPGSPDADKGDGQGAFNGSRVRQARALRSWVPTLQVQAKAVAVALVGDFNAYSQEDPIRVLRSGGYRNAAPQGDYSYSFGGRLGSLDHVLLNAPARARRSSAAVWNLNSVESPAREYSTYRTTALDYYRADARRSSDHDPVIVGFSR